MYGRLDPELDDEETVRHIRACYGGALTMADHWLGKLLDKLDQHRMWDDTVVVLTTDHGHILGERSYWGNMQMALYDELAHIPLIVCAPGSCGGQRVRRALTTTIDLMLTFVELHGMTVPEPVQGRSLCHLLAADADHREAVLRWFRQGRGPDRRSLPLLSAGTPRELGAPPHDDAARQPGFSGTEPAAGGVRLLSQGHPLKKNRKETNSKVVTQKF